MESGLKELLLKFYKVYKYGYIYLYN